MTAPRIYFGPSYGRSIEPEHMKSVFRLMVHPNIVYRPETGDALIERSRARAATRMLKTDCDVLLSVDSDIVFDADAALEICRQAMTHDIVAGVYVTRSRDRCFPTSLMFDNQSIDFAGESRLEEIRWAATGFLAVHRRVFEALTKRDDMPLCNANGELAMYPFYTPFPYRMENGTWNFLSEDFALCERAREVGFKVYLNPKVRLHHLGQYAFRLEDLLHPVPPTLPVRLTRQPNGQYTVETPEWEAPSNGHLSVQTPARGLSVPTPV